MGNEYKQIDGETTFFRDGDAIFTEAELRAFVKRIRKRAKKEAQKCQD